MHKPIRETPLDAPLESAPTPSGFSRPAAPVSLEGIHGTVAVPESPTEFWRNWRAYVGPALLVSVGYMDPGNWGTDLAAGARFKYDLLWVVAMASAMAIFLQILSARLGIVTGKDLAQACRDWYPRWTRWPQWVLCELAIAACDLAEVLGSAVALNLLFHIPLFYAVLITAGDVFLLLALQRYGIRTIEAVVLVLVGTIGTCYFIELFLIPETKPDFLQMGTALLAPGLRREGMAVIAVGIIGATVMPHNLYLHSALVQSRKLQKNARSIRGAILYNTLDTTVALTIAFLINAAILILAAITFYGKTSVVVAGGEVVQFAPDSDWIRVAFLTLAPLLNTAAASILFAVALLASGQSSTITGTLAGQVVMEGFMHWRLSPWVRRLITRGLAILPAIFIIGVRGEGSVNGLLVLSQVVLALQLPLAMFPLLHFTSSRKRMGEWSSGWFLLLVGWTSAIVITAMDVYGLPDSLRGAWEVITGGG
jgi:manganese transport protein